MRQADGSHATVPATQGLSTRGPPRTAKAIPGNHQSGQTAMAYAQGHSTPEANVWQQ